MENQQSTEGIEIVLDKPYQLRLDSRAMIKAERALNRLRGSTTKDWVSIDYLMIEGARSAVEGRGGWCLDLIICVLYSGIDHDDDIHIPGSILPDPVKLLNRLTPERVLELVDQSQLTRGQVVDIVWNAFQRYATKGLPPEEKPAPADPVSQT